MAQLTDGGQQQVNAMYTQQRRILQFYLRLNHPHKPELLAAITNACERLREVNRCHQPLIDEVRSVWKNYYNFPPVFEELMASEFEGPLYPRQYVSDSPLTALPLASYPAIYCMDCSLLLLYPPPSHLDLYIKVRLDVIHCLLCSISLSLPLPFSRR